MTKVSKCLVVALLFLSVGFMGVAAVTTVAGTDWKKYWEEKRYDGSRKTLKQLVDSQTAELNSSQQELEQLNQRIKAAQDALVADSEAIKKREVALLAELNDLNTRPADDPAGPGLIAMTQKVIKKAEDVRTKQEEVKLRRQRVITLREQLDELRALRDATQSRKNLLTGLMIQTQALEASAENRNDSLKKSGAVVPPSPTPPKGG